MLIKDWQNWLMEKRLIRGYFRARVLAILLLLFLICLGLGIYHSYKLMPEGLNYESQSYIVNSSDVNFLKDTTYDTNQKTRQSDQEIFDKMFSYVDSAEQYVLVDMFLFNDFVGKNAKVYKNLSAGLTDKLIAKKKSKPDIRIDVIVDPINTVYGGYASPQLAALEQAGINVIVVDLNPLRDDNPIYSSVWRLLFSWLGNSTHGWLPHPFANGGARVSLRSYLAMINFKADHRKVFLADNQGELVSIITSANAHDASSANSNAALEIKGIFGQEVYKSEAAEAAMSGNSLQPLPQNLLGTKPGANQYVKASLLTEGQIRQAALTDINNLRAGDQLGLAMFYLSDRPIIKALLAAASRGVNIKIILDPSKDAFGYVKNGIPNRQVASELVKQSNNKISVRWYETSGEQFHTKFMLWTNEEAGTSGLIVGSANFTKRNVGNFNLETDVRLSTKRGLGAAQAAIDYFNRLWTNPDGATYTVDYSKYQDDSWLKTWLYRFQEFTGLSSF